MASSTARMEVAHRSARSGPTAATESSMGLRNVTTELATIMTAFVRATVSVSLGACGSHKTAPQARISATPRLTSGQPIAQIVTDSETGVKSAYDQLGTLKARYDPGTNLTYDPQGRAVCRGNNIIAMALDFVDRTAANSPPRG